jgi:hypothetical protein
MLIGYMRVSTDDQNLDLQSDALAKAGCEKVFRDKASGARDDRPGLTQALSHLREGDCLVVWKLDRLGRRMVSLIGFVVIRERTIAGLTAARARGRKGGRKPELSAKQVEHARKLLEDRHTTIKEVAETFGVSRGTIYRSLGLGKFGAVNHIPSTSAQNERPHGSMTGSSLPLGDAYQSDLKRRADTQADLINRLEQQIASVQQELEQARAAHDQSPLIAQEQ